VGLGHAVRAKAVSRRLRELDGNTTVEFVAAEPALSYLKFWGEKVLDVSERLKSLSPIAEASYSEGGLRISLSLALREYSIIKNVETLFENIDLEKYDIIVGDEFWELLASNKINAPKPKVYITDFISYLYKDPLNLPAALAINRYLKARIEAFDKNYTSASSRLYRTKNGTW